jgi:rifampicin phosphotransferase
MPTLKELLSANKGWAAGIRESDPTFFERLAKIQAPEYLWIGCSDSRMTPNESLGLLPGELFVHRNIANLVVYSDMNCLSVMQFAVEVLEVKHVIVCGHYGCGGVKAAMDDSRFGLIDNWLRHIQDLMQKHRDELGAIDDYDRRLDKLCEINVIEQVINAGETTILRNAWERGQTVQVHGWIYTIADGIYRDLGVSLGSNEELEELRRVTASEKKGVSESSGMIDQAKRSFLTLLVGLMCMIPVFAQEATEPAMRERVAAEARAEEPVSYLEKIASEADFDRVARTYHQGTPYSLPHAMFALDRREGNKIYYINSLRFRFHKDFLYANYLIPLGTDIYQPVYIDEDRRFIVGTVAWQPTVKKYTWEVWEGDMATAEHIRLTHEVINRTFFEPVAYKPNSTRQESVSQGLEIPRVLQTDIVKNQEYIALNPGKAVGRIHIIDNLDDTVEIGDNEIVVLRELPISLPPVRGIIVAQPSSPLSHVNVLAKGWGIPNVYIKDADKLFRDKHTYVWELVATMTDYKFNPVDFEAIRERFDSPDQQVPPADLDIKKLTPLAEMRKGDSVAFGAKAANLGEILNSGIEGITVPDGYSIPFHWYAKFMRDNGLDKKAEAMMDEYDFVHVPRYRRQRLDELRKAIMAGRFDRELQREMLVRWRDQLGYAPVFIRSSSNAEDLPNFSGAGLYSTAANVRTGPAFIEGVKKVWASLWNFDAYEARVRNYVSQDDVYMSALVQVGVDMRKGGVLITKDPFNATPGEAVYLSTVCGHNSAVVNNKGIPEQALFVWASDSISVMTLSDQTNSLRFAAGGDLRQTNDQCAGTGGRILTDDEIRKVAGAAKKIHDHFGTGAQDIEWGMIGDRLYIFQARPYLDAVKPFETPEAGRN